MYGAQHRVASTNQHATMKMGTKNRACRTARVGWHRAVTGARNGPQRCPNPCRSCDRTLDPVAHRAGRDRRAGPWRLARLPAAPWPLGVGGGEAASPAARSVPACTQQAGPDVDGDTTAPRTYASQITDTAHKSQTQHTVTIRTQHTVSVTAQTQRSHSHQSAQSSEQRHVDHTTRHLW